MEGLNFRVGSQATLGDPLWEADTVAGEGFAPVPAVGDPLALRVYLLEQRLEQIQWDLIEVSLRVTALERPWWRKLYSWGRKLLWRVA